MEPVQELQQVKGAVNFIREGVKIGLVNGIIALVILFWSYQGSIEVFNYVMIIARFTPYMMLIVIIYGFYLRKKNGQLMTFKDALQYAFLSFVIADLMIAIGTYILYNVVDPDLTRRSIDFSAKKAEEGLAKLDPEHRKDLAKEIEDLRKSDPHTPLQKIVLGLGLELIVDFVKSLVIALIIRREKPAL
jgi:hypothetical protein